MLKAELRHRGLLLTGRKAELVARLQDADVVREAAEPKAVELASSSADVSAQPGDLNSKELDSSTLGTIDTEEERFVRSQSPSPSPLQEPGPPSSQVCFRLAVFCKQLILRRPGCAGK